MISAVLLPLTFATIAWFTSTGAILWLDRLPRSTFPTSLVGATIVSGFGFAAILVSARETGAAGAYVGFVATLLVWGWHEMSFLMGFVTGPRRALCPEGATGWRRFRFATATLIHHEIALALTAAVLVLVTWDQPNRIAALTFLLLFVMRLSAKFNIFLGVPHLADEMMPPHLEYLKSYFRRARGNPLLPLSAVGSLALAALLAQAATRAEAGSGEAVGFGLLFALAALAILEHAFFMLPMRDAALWRWAMPEQYKIKSGRTGR